MSPLKTFSGLCGKISVSYTHLDVYKRQDEGGDARPSQAQDQGAPRNHVKTLLLVYLEADDGSQAHAQRHRHAEKA